jgi:hypothetical protein
MAMTFDRLVRLLDTTARQPIPDQRDDLMNTFVDGIHGILPEKAKEPENANDPVLQEVLKWENENAVEAQAGSVAESVGAGNKQSSRSGGLDQPVLRFASPVLGPTGLP